MVICRLLAENSGYKSKLGTPDELPKKKDGRGRPRKDRTLESSKLYSSPGTSLAPIAASVRSDLFHFHFMSCFVLLALVSSAGRSNLFHSYLLNFIVMSY